MVRAVPRIATTRVIRSRKATLDSLDVVLYEAMFVSMRPRIETLVEPTAGDDAGDGVGGDERYALGAEHARGGLGRILFAYDNKLRRRVAVKELVNASDQAIARFEREALITARLQHPGIVPVYDSGYWDSGEPYYAMKMVEGQSLLDAIERAPKLDDRLALLPHMIDVADAVAYAHGQGVIHRDLKPANVIVGAYGETVVVDWGVAKDLASDDAAPLGPYVDPGHGMTVAGAVLGTPNYMPPEQARGDAVDERADVYALGAMLYHLLAGDAPYADEAPGRVVDRVANGSPASLPSAVPPELAAIVATAMARTPDARYRNASIVAEDLRRFQTGQLVRAHVYSRRQLVWRWLRRYRAIVAVVLVAVVALAVVGALAFARVLAERDRVAAQRAVATARANELVLVQARRSLATDPTESIAWLKSYPATAADWDAARDIAADAASRGVARHILRGHSSALRVAAMPDGQHAVSYGSDGWRMWDLASAAGEVLIAEFVQASGPVVSPNGRYIAGATPANDVVVYDLETRSLRRLPGHADRVWNLAFSPDSTQLATASMDRAIRLWDMRGDAHGVLPEVGGFTWEVSYSPDGKRLATASSDGAVRVWNLAERTSRVLGTHVGEAQSVRFSPDGSFVASAGLDNEVAVRDAATGAELARAKHADAILHLEISPDGRLVAFAGRTGVIGQIDVARNQSRTLTGHTDRITSLEFSPDSTRLLSSSNDGTARVWQLRTGETQTLRGHTDAVQDAVFAAGGAQVVTVGDDSVRVWLAAPPHSERVIAASAWVQGVAANDSLGLLVATGFDGTVWLHDGASDHSRALGRHDGQAYRCGFARATPVTLGQDGIRTWDVASGTSRLLEDSGGLARSLATSVRTDWVAAAAPTGEIRVWNVATGDQRSFTGHTGVVHTLAMSPNGTRLASTGKDGTVRIWDLVAGNAIAESSAHEAAVYDVAWLDDERVVTGGKDGTVRRLRVDGGDSLVLASGDEPVWDVRASSDGALIATVRADGIVDVFDSDGGARARFDGARGAVRRVELASDDTEVVAVTDDGAVWRWSIDGAHTAVARDHIGTVRVVANTAAGPVTAGDDGTVRRWPNRTLGTPRRPEALRAHLETISTAIIDRTSPPVTPTGDLPTWSPTP